MNVPEKLRSIPLWSVWQYEVDDKGKQTKPPLRFYATPEKPYKAKKNEPSHWCDFQQALVNKDSNSFDGLVFCLSAENEITCLDIDNCFDVNGNFVSAKAELIYDRFSGRTYIERSPSGRGLHIFVNGTPKTKLVKSKLCGNASVEIFSNNHSVSVTGDFFGTECLNIAPLQNDLDWVVNEFFSGKSTQPQPTTRNQNIDSTQQLSDDFIIERVSKLPEWSGGGNPDDSTGDWALCQQIRFYTDSENGGGNSQCDRIFRQSPRMRKKWDETGHYSDNRTWGEHKIEEATPTGIYSGLSKTINQLVNNGKTQPEKTEIELPHFWHVGEKGDITLLHANAVEILSRIGYTRVFLDDDQQESTNIFVDGNIVKRVSLENIHNRFFEHVKKMDSANNFFGTLIEKFTKQGHLVINERKMWQLPLSEKGFHADSKHESFFYFKNGVLRVSREGLNLIPYKKIDGLVWADSIINRDFEQSNDPNSGMFAKFVWNTCCPPSVRTTPLTDDELQTAQMRFKALKIAIGYLCHRYDNPACIKAVILNDEKVTHGENNGGSGKSMFFKALKCVRNACEINGKSVDFSDRFAFQKVQANTELMAFEDACSKFPFEKMYNFLDTGYEFQKKFGDLIKLPASVKTLLTTNHAIAGMNASDSRRRHDLEISPYYEGDVYSPVDDFGCGEFFSDIWGDDNWNDFFNFIASCSQAYFENNLNLFSPPKINIDFKKLAASTRPEFVEFAEDIPLNTKINKSDLWDKFKEEYPDFDRSGGVRQNTFSGWLSIFAKAKSYGFLEQKSNGKRFFTFVVETKKVSSSDFETLVSWVHSDFRNALIDDLKSCDFGLNLARSAKAAYDRQVEINKPVHGNASEFSAFSVMFDHINYILARHNGGIDVGADIEALQKFGNGATDYFKLDADDDEIPF